jgi:carbamoyltransferase
MKILGLKLTHDGAIALIDNGSLIFSYEMEKIKNNPRYSVFCIPIQEVKEILSEYGYSLDQVDLIVIDGWDSWDVQGVRALEVEEAEMISEFIWEGKEVRITTDELAGYGRIGNPAEDILRPQAFEFREQGLYYRSYQHVSGHAAGAYCTSNFALRQEDAFVLIWDGGTPPQLFYYEYKGNKFTCLGILFPLMGYIYIDFAFAFKPFCLMTKGLSIAGKAMAYMALGRVQPAILEKLRKIFSSLMEDVNVDALEIDVVAILTQEFVSEAKEYAAAGGYKDEDMLASFQEFIRQILLEYLSSMVKACPEGYTRNLCLVGGCALNIKWNSSIRNSELFREVWVPPFPNDSGSAIGVACCEMLVSEGIRALKWNVYSGPRIRSAPGMGSTGKDVTCEYSMIPCSLEKLAWILHMYNEPVVFLNASAELGPRALGNRSILAPAVAPEMKSRLNAMKGRENYRPVAPICLEEYAQDIFYPGTADPYMLFEHYVRPDWVKRVPAICHLDGTARLQTVNWRENEQICALLKAYHQISGVPLLCNTSANFNGSGFFPDLESAMRWNKANLIWNGNNLYINNDFPYLEALRCVREDMAGPLMEM